MVGGELLPEVAIVMGGDRFPQRDRAPRRSVLVRAFLQSLRGRFEYFVGPTKIWETLPEIDCIVPGGGQRHALEDADLHLLVERVHERAHSAVDCSPRERHRDGGAGALTFDALLGMGCADRAHVVSQQIVRFAFSD